MRHKKDRCAKGTPVFFMLEYSSFALVVQWIEQSRPKG